MSFNDVLLYILSFVAIWFGAGLIINSIDGFSSKLKISSFSLSFFVLGILTSIPEFAVGMTAISQQDPQIFVGNLLGADLVLFLFVIPLLAIFGKGIRVSHELTTKKLLFSLIVVLTPFILIIDKVITNTDATFLILSYLALLILMEFDKRKHEVKSQNILQANSYSLLDIISLVGGIAIVFVTSHVIVEKTLLVSQTFKVSEFLISLLMISFGTNLPEISIAVRSIFSGKKDIAFGDYIGSAATNTFLMGILTLINPNDVLIQSNMIVITIFMLVAAVLFFGFAKSGRAITKQEGLALMTFYVIFLAVEIFLR